MCANRSRREKEFDGLSSNLHCGAVSENVTQATLWLFPWPCLSVLTSLCVFLTVFLCVSCGCLQLYIIYQRNKTDWFYQKQWRSDTWLTGVMVKTMMMTAVFILKHFTRPSLVALTVKKLLAMQETWVRSLGWEDPLEKETANPSSIIAWRILWTEEPGGLQSLGSQRVRHDWRTNTFTLAF